MQTVETNGITVHRFVWDHMDSNAYVIIEDGEMLVIDPNDTEEFREFIGRSGITACRVFLTHEHFDHISGLNGLREAMACTVYASSECSVNIGKISGNLSKLANVIVQFGKEPPKNDSLIAPFTCAPADVVFDEKLELRWHRHQISFVHTPGHSRGSICFIMDGKVMFSGDTLLAIPAITRFPGGSTKDYMKVTIPWFEDLDGIKYVFPGHGPSGHFIEMMWLNELL